MDLQITQQLAKPLYDANVQPSTLIPKQVGNMYTASIYATLYHFFITSMIHWYTSSLLLIYTFGCFTFTCLNGLLLNQSWNRVIMFSYGSGSPATMFSLKLNEGQHPFSLSNIAAILNVDKKLKSRHVLPTNISIILNNCCWN